MFDPAVTQPPGTHEEETEMCTVTLENGPLTCVRTDAHVTGHVYQSQSGSWVRDRHEDAGHG